MKLDAVLTLEPKTTVLLHITADLIILLADPMVLQAHDLQALLDRPLVAVAELPEEISKMSSTDLANMYLDNRHGADEGSPQTRDFTEQEVGELKGIVGGDQQYTQMLDWAQGNLNKQEIEMFDQVMQTGDPLAAFFAVRSLGYAYQNAIGYDGNMIQGKAPQNNRDVFRSQAELVAAMSDKRYDNDPAYRQDVIQKLERSDNLEF